MSVISVITVAGTIEAILESAVPFLDLIKSAGAGGTVSAADAAAALTASQAARNQAVAKLDADIAAAQASGGP